MVTGTSTIKVKNETGLFLFNYQQINLNNKFNEHESKIVVKFTTRPSRKLLNVIVINFFSKIFNLIVNLTILR